MYTCPNPGEWHRVHRELLRARARAAVQPPEPPIPLILGGWVYSSAREKHERWTETVAWAREHGCGAIVESIPREEYEHWDTDVPGWSPDDDNADDGAPGGPD